MGTITEQFMGGAAKVTDQIDSPNVIAGVFGVQPSSTLSIVNEVKIIPGIYFSFFTSNS